MSKTLKILISLGLALFTIGLIFSKYSQETVNLYDIDNFGQFALFAVIIAPIIEELIFRGPIIKRKKLSISIIIILTLNLIISAYTRNFAATFLTSLFIVSSLLYIKKDSKANFWFIVTVSSVSFGMSHYNAILNKLNLLNLPYIQLGLGFILCAITFKFGLKKSIIVHSVYNTFITLWLFLTIQFPDSETFDIEQEQFKICIKQVPYYKKDYRSSSYSKKDGTHIYKNISIKKLLKYPPMSKFNPTSQWMSNDYFSRYNIEIKFLDDNEFDAELIIKELERRDFLKKR